MRVGTIWVWVSGWLWGSTTMHWVFVASFVALAAFAIHMRRETKSQAAERWRERRIREELEAYAGLNISVGQGLHPGVDGADASRALAKRVCRTVAEKSSFTRVAMLLRNPEGRFVCVGSVGTDDLTIAALHAWGERLVADENGGRSVASALAPGMVMGLRGGIKSFAIPLGEWNQFDSEIATWALGGRTERRKWRRAVIAPIRTGSAPGSAHRLMGVISVCADGERLDGGGENAFQAWVAPHSALGGSLAKAMGPIETLADRLATAMENEALAERLLKTEKLAGLGQLAGGVAHALNNPLTAVLGFAELIAETSSETRVRQDAGTILSEAKKMKETVQRLVEFWRPVTVADEAVDVAGILDGLRAACGQKLKERGVKLEIAGALTLPMVRGSRDRLRQVFEHLLNNAAQAIATAREREVGEEHAIRVTVSHDDQSLHVIVSDTGPGFREPGRVFDPFYTTKGPEQGAGLGLSICYGIVREHGGEISAFNLHPLGAAVVVELPVGRIVTEESVVVREREQTNA